jgi:hypothetical protein
VTFQAEEAMSTAERIGRWASDIAEASRRFGIPQSWIKAVMRMESGGRTLTGDKQPITSAKGAMGVMQIMPATWQDLRQQLGVGADPYDPHQNVLAGAAYLRWLYDRFGFPKLFAAYNAGPGTLDALGRGGQLPRETRAYVSGIGKILGVAMGADAPATSVAMLTRPDGVRISVDGASVDSLRAPLPDEYAPGVKTVITMGYRHQGVLEDVAKVRSLLGLRTAKA